MSGSLISIVILEYYSQDEVERCIESIKTSLKDHSYEIIISSNSCYDKLTSDQLKERFEGVEISCNELNGGFAYGMNRGLQLARGKYIAIVNPDVIVLDGFGKMISFLDNNPWVGAIGPQMLDDSGIIQDTCRNYVSIHGLVLRQIRRIFNESPVREFGVDYNLVQTADWLAGAFLMITRYAYEATGGMDERYFMYAEDLDWCTRIREAGLEIIYFPPMKVNYAGTRIARKLNNYTWIFIKSHFRYWLKYGFFSGYPKREKRIFN